MKVVKEALLMNDLKETLAIVEDSVLIMRENKEPIVLITLSEYNKMKEAVYKNSK